MPLRDLTPSERDTADRLAMSAVRMRRVRVRSGDREISAKFIATGEQAANLYEIMSLACWPLGTNVDVTDGETL